MICDECETVAHCLKNGCVPKHQPAPEQYTALEQALTRLQKRYGELEAKVAAQRQWVGLTDDELRELCDEFWLYPRKLLQAIEAKLREKNT
jgi:hypothetical protein